MHTATWQKLFRHLSTFASPPVPCEWPRHQRGPRARCPPPAHRPPAALPPTLRHGPAPAGGFSQPRGGLDIKKAAGRNTENPHHLFGTAAASRTPALPLDQSSARWH